MPPQPPLPPTPDTTQRAIPVTAGSTPALTGSSHPAPILSPRKWLPIDCQALASGRTLWQRQPPIDCQLAARHWPPAALGPQPRILVIKLATLGDLLLATPALRALRLRYPTARIDLLTTPDAAPLLAGSPLMSHVYTLDKYTFDTPRSMLQHSWRLIPTLLLRLAKLRRTHYDAVLLPHHLTLRFGRLKYRLLLIAIGARLTAGLDNGWGGFLDLRVPDNGFGARHEAEYCQAIAEAVDAPLPPGDHSIHLTDLGWNDICVPPASQPREATPLIAVHPGSGSYSLARRWPIARYAELARRLHRDYNAKLLLIGGPEERPLAQNMLDLLDHPDWAEDATGAHTPHQLATRLSKCALFVGNDSFPMHLAAAVGIPTVAIFGPSNADAWGPYTPDTPERARIVRRTDLACMPCIYRGHALGTPQGCPPRPCLTELSVASVLRAAHAIYPAQPT